MTPKICCNMQHLNYNLLPYVPRWIHQCPNCENMLSAGIYYAGSSVIRRDFSDGRTVPPGAPVYPVIIKCSKCETIRWTSNLIRIRKDGKSQKAGASIKIDERWEKLEREAFLTLDEYIEALIKGIYSSACEENNYEEEVYIRDMIHWGFNDRTRSGEPLFQHDSDKSVYTDNIYWLLKDLNMNDSFHRTKIAELHRNLGEFEKCMEILKMDRRTPTDCMYDAFEKECNLKNTLVFEYPRMGISKKLYQQNDIELYISEGRIIDSGKAKRAVYNRIKFELPNYLWNEIDTAFGDCWNNVIGMGEYIYEGQIEQHIYNHMKSRKIIFEYEKVEIITKIIFDYMWMTGGLSDD